jgi:hypothetical protein
MRMFRRIANGDGEVWLVSDNSHINVNGAATTSGAAKRTRVL